MAQRMEGVASVLDVGCGTGRRLEELSLYLEDRIELRGVDVALRDEPPLPCTRTPELERFDGRHLAFEDDRFDVVMICYVLHHLNPVQAAALLGEALRVARRQVMILEDSLPHWNLGYRIRNWAHLADTNLLYRSEGGDFQPYLGLQGFLTHDEWTRLFESDARVKRVELDGLHGIKRYAHHTLFVLSLD